MATSVTLLTRYKDLDFYERKNSPTYYYAGIGGGGGGGGVPGGGGGNVSTGLFVQQSGQLAVWTADSNEIVGFDDLQYESGCLTVRGGAGKTLYVAGDSGYGRVVFTDKETDATTKSFRLLLNHYTNSEGEMTAIYANSSSANNYVSIGGGTSAGKAATIVRLYAAANQTTPTGTIQVEVDYSNVQLNYQGAERLKIVDAGVDVQGRMIAYQTSHGTQAVYGNQIAPRVSSNATNNDIVSTSAQSYNFDIATGIVDSGYRIGHNITAYSNDADFLGTLARQVGTRIQYGHYDLSGSGTLTTVRGIQLDYVHSGASSVGTAYSILSASTIPTFWHMGPIAPGGDLYSADTTFVSGFTGSGWKLDKVGSGGSAEYKLEVDELIVRGLMKVYEIEINKIRATNGTLWVTDAVTVVSIAFVGGIAIYDVTIDDDGGNNPHPFVVNDYLRGQNWTGRDVKVMKGLVTADVSSSVFRANFQDGPDLPAEGDVLVRIGHYNNPDRQGSIYLTSNESDSPYIDILDGVDSHTIEMVDIKARLGNLDGITDAVMGALSGYGLYSQNVYLRGEIVASTGLIGGWTLGSDAIYTGTKKTTDGFTAAGVTLASNGSLRATKFYINADGDCAFRQIEEALFKTDGDNYGIKVSGGHIWENELNSDAGYILINYKGYQGGTTRYRSTVIADGKEGQMMIFKGVDQVIQSWKRFEIMGGLDYRVYDYTAQSGTLPNDRIVGLTTSVNRTVYLSTTAAEGQVHIIKRGGSGTCTVDGNGEDIYTTSIVSSVVLGAGESITVIWFNAVWYVISGYS